MNPENHVEMFLELSSRTDGRMERRRKRQYPFDLKGQGVKTNIYSDTLCFAVKITQQLLAVFRSNNRISVSGFRMNMICVVLDVIWSLFASRFATWLYIYKSCHCNSYEDWVPRWVPYIFIRIAVSWLMSQFRSLGNDHQGDIYPHWPLADVVITV